MIRYVGLCVGLWLGSVAVSVGESVGESVCFFKDSKIGNLVLSSAFSLVRPVCLSFSILYLFAIVDAKKAGCHVPASQSQ